MIVIGSVAARLGGVALPGTPADVDLIGTREELKQFTAQNQGYIQSEAHVHGHRARFSLKPGLEWQRVEFDYEGSKSDRMLAALSTGQRTRILHSEVFVPSINALYLIKRAHANIALNFQKTIIHMKLLHAQVAAFSAAELAFCEARKKECLGRFEKHPSRFTLDVSNDDFFAVSNHIRTYEHDDLHKAIAFNKGRPVYERCKRDLSSARIDQDLFLEMPIEDQTLMLQEEFIVVGLERFYFHNRALANGQVFWLGMLKTMRDLFTGWFQNYCLDHVGRLSVPPNYDFVARFVSAEQNDELRLLRNDGEVADGELGPAIRLFSANRLAEAEQHLLETAKDGDNPEHNQALLYLARIARRREQNEIAAYYYRNVLKAEPTLIEARNELGNALRASGKAEEAMACYRQAISDCPSFAPAYVNLGAVLEITGQLEAAIETCLEGLRNKGEDQLLRQRLQELVQRKQSQRVAPGRSA